MGAVRKGEKKKAYSALRPRSATAVFLEARERHEQIEREKIQVRQRP